MNAKNSIRRFPLLACMLLLPALWACPPSDDLLLTPAVAPVRIVAEFATGPTDPFEATTYALNGSVLTVNVRYSGGCEAHEFVGLVGSSVAESLPVQMWGRIAHDDRDDPCDGIVDGTITFDLTPVKDLYAAAYGAGPGTVILHLAPLPEALRFTF